MPSLLLGFLDINGICQSIPAVHDRYSESRYGVLFCFALASTVSNSSQGTRVEKEHMQYLKDAQRIEDRSGGPNVSTPNLGFGGNSVDFESLVGGGAPNTKTLVTS